MANGSRIIQTQSRGFPVEGIVNAGETLYPGMIVQIDPTQSAQGETFIMKIYNRDADGDRPAGPHIVVCEDIHQGLTTADSYAAGARFPGFVPLAGCRLNLLFKNVSGTADDVVAGDLFIVDDATGKMIVTTGTVEAEVAMALEAVTDPTADTLVDSIWSGH